MSMHLLLRRTTRRNRRGNLRRLQRSCRSVRWSLLTSDITLMLDEAACSTWIGLTAWHKVSISSIVPQCDRRKELLLAICEVAEQHIWRVYTRAFSQPLCQWLPLSACTQWHQQQTQRQQTPSHRPMLVACLAHADQKAPACIWGCPSCRPAPHAITEQSVQCSCA